jgi:hypothetical protein
MPPFLSADPCRGLDRSDSLLHFVEAPEKLAISDLEL